MLHYGFSRQFINQLAKQPFEERIDILWKVQGFLSHVPGYLRKKIDGNEEDLFFSVSDESYILMHDDFEHRVLCDYQKGPFNPTVISADSVYYEQPIVDLLKTRTFSEETNSLLHIAIQNHFPIWFLNLLASLPVELLKILFSAETLEVLEEIPPTPLAPAKEDAPIQSAPIVEQKFQILKTSKNHKKFDVDGEKFEKEILKQLAKGYELRRKEHKVTQTKPLQHVRFAKQELIVPFVNLSDCLFLLNKRTKKYGCKNFNNNWKILLALNMPEWLERELEARYPHHVCYTDEPNKGALDIAIIVKYAKEVEKPEPQVKRVASKTASFQQELPEGAFENIDEEDIPEMIYDSSIKLFRPKNVTHVSNQIKIEQVEEEMEDFFETSFLDDEFDFDLTEAEKSPIVFKEEEERAPAHWRCFLCGNKKTYNGEPAETVRLASGKIVYLCKKHRGKM